MERKIMKQMDWNLSHTTPWSLLDEVMRSVGYPDARIHSNSHLSMMRLNLEQQLNPIIRKMIQRYEFDCLPPSYLLRAALDYLDSIQELKYTKLHPNVLEQLLPIDEVLFSLRRKSLKIFKVL
jgi:hypothetical protein